MTAYTRSYALDDIQVRSGGDGRTVEAYAAVFETPTHVVDQDGEYEEVCDPRMFNRAIEHAARAKGGWNIPVMYNHGQTLYGTASDRHAVPIGVPEEIKVDGKGLFTRTRFHKSALAEEILEAIREGSIRAYSFAGVFHRSDPLVPRGGFRADLRGTLPRVRRTESSLREYGPTPFAVYPQAEIVGVRAEQAALLLNRLPAEEFERLLTMVRSGAATLVGKADDGEDEKEEQEPQQTPDTPADQGEAGPVADDSPPATAQRHSDRHLTPREVIQAKRAAWIVRQREDSKHATG